MYRPTPSRTRRPRWSSQALADGLESWPSDTGKPTDLPVTYVPGGNTTRDGDAKANGSNKEVNIFTLDIAQVQLLRHALERGGFVAAMGVGTPRKHRQHWDSRREHAEKGNGGDGGVRGGSHGDGSGRLGPQSRHQEQDHGSINRALSGYEMALCLRVHRLSKGISALRILWCVFGFLNLLSFGGNTVGCQKKRVQRRTAESSNDLRCVVCGVSYAG